VRHQVCDVNKTTRRPEINEVEPLRPATNAGRLLFGNSIAGHGFGAILACHSLSR
jgi:hypothetical protein